MQRCGQGAPAQASRTRRGQHAHVEPFLQFGLPGHPQPVEQAAVGGAAPQEDVLAVVDGQAVAGEGAGGAAQPWPRLGERHPGAAVT